MKLTLTIPDALYETLKEVTPNTKTVEATATAILSAFPVDLRERPVLISNSHRKSLEKLLNAPLPTAAELITRVQNLSSIHIGAVRLEPTPAQLRRLADRAKKNKRTPQEEAQSIFESIAVNYFGYV